MIKKIKSYYYKYGIKGFLILIINCFISIFSNINKFIIKVLNFIARRLPPKFFITWILNYLSDLFSNNKRVRNYIKNNISIEEFFSILNKRNVQYVILRWFNDLPHIDHGEDIDILINDNDINKVKNLFTYKPNEKKIDLYTITAMYGYRSMPYYPSRIARIILEERILYKDNYYVPSPFNYFLSLSYHALYHKAEKSGLIQKNIEFNNIQKIIPEHPYKEILENMAVELNINININLDDLHSFLTLQGWNPSIDTLRKLSFDNKSIWQNNLLPKQNKNIANDGELIVFIVREWVITHNKLDVVLDILNDRNFYIIKLFEIDENQKQIVIDNIRGGEWGKGPYPVAGGHPSYCIIAFDFHPIPLDDKLKRKYPFVFNKNVLLKNYIRDFINRGMLRTKWTNCLHSSDDEIEALEYIKFICPDEYTNIKDQVQLLRTEYKTKYNVLKLIKTNNTRAKIELIEYNKNDHTLAIKKTYKHLYKRFLEREIFVYSTLSKKYNYIPPLLEYSDNYLIIPYYNDILSGKNLKERIKIIKGFEFNILNALYSFYDEGYALIDFKPRNIIITENKELYLIDFEFLYKYINKPKSFEESYDIIGVPKNIEMDLPKGFKYPGNTYKNIWKKIFKKSFNKIKYL